MPSVSLKSIPFLKSTLFPVIYLIIQNQITNIYLTKITLIIEFLQMYSHPLHPKVKLFEYITVQLYTFWKSSTLHYLSYSIQFFKIVNITLGNEDVYLILLYTCEVYGRQIKDCKDNIDKDILLQFLIKNLILDYTLYLDLFCILRLAETLE